MITRFLTLVLIIALTCSAAIAQQSDPQKEECTSGKWMADAIRVGTSADCSIITATEVLGAVTHDKNIKSRSTSVAPEPIVVIDISGVEIKAVLTECLRSYPRKSLRFPHISNLTLVFIQTDKTVTNLKINNIPVDDSKIYKLATTEFLAESLFNKPYNADQQFYLNDLTTEYQNSSNPIETQSSRIIIK